MRTLVWFIYFWGYMLLHLSDLRRGTRALEAGDWATADALAAEHVPHWANRLLKLAGVTVTVEGLVFSSMLSVFSSVDAGTSM